MRFREALRVVSQVEAKLNAHTVHTVQCINPCGSAHGPNNFMKIEEYVFTINNYESCCNNWQLVLIFFNFLLTAFGDLFVQM